MRIYGISQDLRYPLGPLALYSIETRCPSESAQKTGEMLEHSQRQVAEGLDFANHLPAALGELVVDPLHQHLSLLCMVVHHLQGILW